MSRPDVQVSRLGKRFDGSDWILRDLSLEVESGTSLAILGESGVGKSVFLRVLAGLEKASEGQVFVSGSPVGQPKQSVGYMMQDYTRSLFPWLSIKGNLKLALHSHSLSRSEIDNRINAALDDVGLTGNGDRYPWETSGGMQQRAVLARVLLGSPKVLLLDEPFGSLDTSVKWGLQDMMRSLCQERHITTILVTHDIEEAIYMSDRIITIGSRPARVTWDGELKLGTVRHQSITRVQPEFLNLRAKLLGMALSNYSSSQKD
jgi:NitT/TauT family transport system ATP-binding protein